MTPAEGNGGPSRPVVGVFDSGFGGLTVLRQLLLHMPGADFVYLGDTAHLPYGSKSQAAVTRFTAAAIRLLVSRGAELVVVACNTASALALPSLDENPPVPLLGVIKPGAETAADAVLTGRGAPLGSTAVVLATEATVASHAYASACAANGLLAVEKACPLFVPLVEEGWTGEAENGGDGGGNIPGQVATIYLREALAACAGSPEAVVLGCTHYPLLRPLLERTVRQLMGDIPVVDSAEATARQAALLLPHAVAGHREPTLEVLATDSPAKFQRLGARFLGRELPTVTHVELED